MTNTPFTRKDVVTIQDPSNPALRQYTLLPGVETPAKHATKKPGIRNTNVITQRVMEQVCPHGFGFDADACSLMGATGCQMKKKEAEKEAERTKAQKRKRQEQAAAAVAVANDPEKQKAARHTARLAFLASQARKTHNISVGTYSGSFTSSSISVVRARTRGCFAFPWVQVASLLVALTVHDDRMHRTPNKRQLR